MTWPQAMCTLRPEPVQDNEFLKPKSPWAEDNTDSAGVWVTAAWLGYTVTGHEHNTDTKFPLFCTNQLGWAALMGGMIPASPHWRCKERGRINEGSQMVRKRHLIVHTDRSSSMSGSEQVDWWVGICIQVRVSLKSHYYNSHSHFLSTHQAMCLAPYISHLVLSWTLAP
jgi:hypothetical protein